MTVGQLRNLLDTISRFEDNAPVLLAVDGELERATAIWHTVEAERGFYWPDQRPEQGFPDACHIRALVVGS
jgi:hypothetical protein